MPPCGGWRPRSFALLIDSRIGPIHAFSLPARVDCADYSINFAAFGGHQAERIAAFLRNTSDDDRYWRFGNSSIASAEWLIERVQSDRTRGAYVAEGGGQLIGLLDFVAVGDEIEFGVLVHRVRRRHGVGSSLVRAFLDGVARLRPGARIVAYCDRENRAVLRVLRTFGLRAVQLDGDWSRFETIVAACDC
jgi:RimJ/RimL family protein N-acetyltransferase